MYVCNYILSIRKEYYKGDNLTYILTHVEIDTKHRIKFFFLLIFNEKCYLFKRKRVFILLKIFSLRIAIYLL